jgi:uncharacterized protein YlxW (UPF0749 family)
VADAPHQQVALPEHVTTPLLTLLTRRSLDADYEHVAARRRAAGESPAKPTRAAAAVLLVFGGLVTVAAIQTSRNAPAVDASRTSLVEQIDLRRTSVEQLQRQAARLTTSETNLRTRLSNSEASVGLAQSKLQRLQVRTGYGEVHGPGVQATVSDPPNADPDHLVRDSDLALLADGFWGAGAEAISVNGQRLTVLSSFRNVGFGILLNTQPITPPYVFSVIGNPQTLQADLLANSAGARWYAVKNSFGFGFKMVDGGTMALPAAPDRPLRSVRVAPHTNPDTQTQEDAP